MSALGQKQTCAVRKAMSALRPKADIRGANTTAVGHTYDKARTGQNLATPTIPQVRSPGRESMVLTPFGPGPRIECSLGRYEKNTAISLRRYLGLLFLLIARSDLRLLFAGLG